MSIQFEFSAIERLEDSQVYSYENGDGRPKISSRYDFQLNLKSRDYIDRIEEIGRRMGYEEDLLLSYRRQAIDALNRVQVLKGKSLIRLLFQHYSQVLLQAQEEERSIGFLSIFKNEVPYDFHCSKCL